MGELGKAILLGIIEGLTEFVPVSSTGHLLLCEKWMHLNLDEPFWKMFTVFIQIGAILAVVVYFRHKIVQLLSGSISGNTISQKVVMMVIIATIPVLIVGYLFHKWVELHMERPLPIALALLIGGLSRPAAAEFSFLLAIPAMAAASGYSLLKGAGGMNGGQMTLLLVGTLVSFLVAWAVIAIFMEYIRKHTFTPFGVYRIVLGIVVLIVMRRG